jgi:cytochrome c oxidase assembly protein subunit 11
LPENRDGANETVAMKRSQQGNKRTTAIVLSGLVVGMVGLSFASVPLYRLFCEVTGYGGTPKTAGVTASADVVDEVVTVRFDSNVNSGLPWRFRPEQREVTVNLGAEQLIHYEAVNLSDRPVTGTATFSVIPYKAAQYFAKIQCFCFTEQRLEPGEAVSMPVIFYVDPAMLEDRDARDVRVITLSYTFFPVHGPVDGPSGDERRDNPQASGAKASLPDRREALGG